jgi:fructose-1,6-bisphosphatase I
VLFDPLDGSSNLDVCGGVGTIFSILRHDRRAATPRGLAAAARRAAGRGRLRALRPVDVFVLTIGQGVDMFVLDPRSARSCASSAACASRRRRRTTR